MFGKNKMNIIYILILLLATYLLITFALYFFQRNLLYYPAVNNYFGEKLTFPVEKVKINTQDKVELLSWYYSKNHEVYKTVLFLVLKVFPSKVVVVSHQGESLFPLPIHSTF